MEFSTRKSVNDKLSKYDLLCNKQDEDFIEVTEWTNGEGWDIYVKDRHIQLTYGELEAINYLTKALDVEKK